MPQYQVRWSFSEIFEAHDEKAALELVQERMDKFTQPARFQVNRSVSFDVEVVPPGTSVPQGPD